MEIKKKFAGLDQDPVPDHRPKIDLHDAHAIRRELAQLYREARAGTLEPGVATKLAHILQLVLKAYEKSELQARLEQLELTIGQRRPQS